MNTAKVYYDTDGNERTILQMVKHEPVWAGVRIQEGEKAIERVKILEQYLRNISKQEGSGGDPYEECSFCMGELQQGIKNFLGE